MAFIYERNFNRLEKLTGGLAAFLSSPDPGYKKIENEPFMDLHIDRLGPDRLALAHNIVVNGDVVPDLDMEVRVVWETGMVEAMTMQNQFCFKAVYPEPGKVDVDLKTGLNKFLEFWLVNLRKQGFYK